MLNIQSKSSQESLFKAKIEEITKNVDTTNRILDYINDLVKKNSLDYELLAERLNKAIDNTPNIVSPYNFITKIAYSEVISNGNELKKPWTRPNFLALHLAFIENGFSGEEWEKLLIDMVEEHCLVEFPIELERMIVLNTKIMDYCIQKDRKTYSYFLAVFLNSKLGKECNIPLAILKSEAQSCAKDMLNTIESIESKKECLI